MNYHAIMNYHALEQKALNPGWSGRTVPIINDLLKVSAQ